MNVEIRITCDVWRIVCFYFDSSVTNRIPAALLSSCLKPLDLAAPQPGAVRVGDPHAHRAPTSRIDYCSTSISSLARFAQSHAHTCGNRHGPCAWRGACHGVGHAHAGPICVRVHSTSQKHHVCARPDSAASSVPLATGTRNRSIISCGSLDLRLNFRLDVRLALLFATILFGSQSLASVRVSVGIFGCLRGRGCLSVLGRFDCGRGRIGRATLQRPRALHLRHAAPDELRTSRRMSVAQGVGG